MIDPDSMMALRAHARGGPEQLVWEPAPRPVPAAGEVVVRVEATGITFAEFTWDLSWQTADGIDRTPVIPGHELVGRVSDIASDVVDVAVGDEVWALVPFDRDGAAAEYVAIEASIVAPSPRTIDAAAAAALPLSALTAWQALVDHAHLEPGELVLVHGGAGGVGVYAVQLAVALGAAVTSTCSQDDIDFVRGLGAHEVIDRNTDPDDVHLNGFDVVIDTVGGDVLDRSYRALRLGGRLITLTEPPPPGRASQYGVEASFFIVEPNRDQLTHLADLVDSGSLRSVVAQAFPISQGRAAYESVDRPRGPGKTVLVAAGSGFHPGPRSTGDHLTYQERSQ